MSIQDFFEALKASILQTDFITWAATVTAIAYVVLAAYENILCWPAGIISSGLSVMVYVNTSLINEAFLNVIYCFLGIYGWYIWRKSKGDKKKRTGERSISRMKRQYFQLAVLLSLVTGLLLGYITHYFHYSTFPYSDSLITVFSITATWMTAEKYIENWILWIAADFAAAIVYFIKGPELYLFGILFIFYTIISVKGFITWKKTLSEE